MYPNPNQLLIDDTQTLNRRIKDHLDQWFKNIKGQIKSIGLILRINFFNWRFWWVGPKFNRFSLKECPLTGRLYIDNGKKREDLNLLEQT